MINLYVMFFYNEMNLDIGFVLGKMNIVIYINVIIMLYVYVFLNIFKCVIL